jgi:DNA-binding MarR family transcriptional regulator
MPNAADRFISALEAFRQLDPEMPAQTVLTFLTVATNPGIGMSKLAEKLGIAMSSTSRNVFVLSRFKQGQTPGHDLISSEMDPDNRRAKILTLTPKGERFYAHLQRIMSH